MGSLDMACRDNQHPIAHALSQTACGCTTVTGRVFGIPMRGFGGAPHPHEALDDVPRAAWCAAGGVLEREAAKHHDVQDDAARPHICSGRSQAS